MEKIWELVGYRVYVDRQTIQITDRMRGLTLIRYDSGNSTPQNRMYDIFVMDEHDMNNGLCLSENASFSEWKDIRTEYERRRSISEKFLEEWLRENLYVHQDAIWDLC